MPIQSERAQAINFSVTPSAPLELMWVLHNSGADHELKSRFATTEPVRLAYGPTVRAFWPDQIRGFTEMVVLAERSGSLRDPEMRGFFAGVERAATSNAATPSLLSESPAERSAIGRRLEILRTDAVGRARYISLLEDGWGAVEVEGEQTGPA